MTLSELIETYQRRATEAAVVGSSAPVAKLYELIVAELLPLVRNGGPVAGSPPAPADRWLSAAQVAALLGTSVRWVYDHQGELGAKRLSRRCLRLSEAAVRRRLEGRR